MNIIWGWLIGVICITFVGTFTGMSVAHGIIFGVVVLTPLALLVWGVKKLFTARR